MTNTYKPPFASYTALTGAGADSTAVTNLQAALAAIKALIVPASGAVSAHPDFDKIPAQSAAAIAAELDAMSASITAAS